MGSHLTASATARSADSITTPLWLMAYLKPHWRAVSFVVLMVVVSDGLQLLNPQFIRELIDHATTPHDNVPLLPFAVAYICVSVIQQAAYVGATGVGEQVAWHATNVLRLDVTSHCLHQDFRFHQRHQVGALLECIDGDTTLLASLFSRATVEAISSSLLVTGIIVALSLINWQIGLSLATIAVAVILSLALFRRQAAPFWHAGREASAQLTGYLTERLVATEEIAPLGSQTYVLYGLHRIMNTMSWAYRRARGWSTIGTGVVNCALAVGLATGLVEGGQIYMHHGARIGQVFLIANYIAMIYGPITVLTERAGDYQQARVSIKRIRSLLSERVSAPAQGCLPAPAGPLGVSFQHVYFHYVPEEPLLHDVTFYIPPGASLALIGPTGSGKTTLARLLFRMAVPTSGRIHISQADIAAYSRPTLRSRIAFVTQNVQLFPGTVRDNITVFTSGFTDAELLEAIQDIGLREWLSRLPQGLDTPIRGETSLSAGEAQLLALARAHIRRPGLLILDEASSRLDRLTEVALHTALDKMSTACTTLIIAHRMQTIRRAGTVVVLESGRITEQGSPEDFLLQPNSYYARLVRQDADGHLP